MINLEFLIQSKNTMYNHGKIPMHEFGYATIEAIDYKNWWDNKKTHSYILMDKVEISKNDTDIIELHDFFACGLYNFSHQKLLKMMIETQRDLNNRIDKKGV